ncbi:UNVERIFIED_CONTAM: hypothetical protein FKN15_015164 [Acipenser sinensis]
MDSSFFSTTPLILFVSQRALCQGGKAQGIHPKYQTSVSDTPASPAQGLRSELKSGSSPAVDHLIKPHGNRQPELPTLKYLLAQNHCGAIVAPLSVCIATEDRLGWAQLARCGTMLPIPTSSHCSCTCATIDATCKTIAIVVTLSVCIATEDT